MSGAKHLLSRSIAAAAMILAVATSAHATTINFNTTAGSGGFGDGFVGNVRTWNAGGVTVTATAWYANPNSIGTAALGQYSGAGLGVCNSQEWGSSFPCESPNHAIDNVGQYDFVLFSFSQAVDLQEVGLYTFDGYDDDVSFWLGNGVTTLAGKALNNLPGGLGSRSDVDNDTSVDLQPGHLLFNSLMFGAQTTSDNDRFKIKYLTFDVPTTQQLTSTPEPASLVLFGTGLAGLAAAIRRKARRA